MSEQETTPEAQLAQYEAGPAQLRQALAGLSRAQYDLAQAEGEWSIREIVHHLAEGEMVFSMCIKAAAGKPGCTFALPPYTSNEEWAIAQHWAARAVEPALDLFQANRADTAELLRRVPGIWERHVRLTSAENPEGQEMAVARIVPMLADHLQEHIDQILAIRRAHGL